MRRLVRTSSAVDPDVLGIGEGGATCEDGLPEHLDDGRGETALPGQSECVTRTCRPEPRPVTDLIGVDVADPGDEGLVEQKRLQRAMSLPEPSPELAEVEAVAQRIGPEPRELRYLPVDISGIEHHHLAEGSGIDEEHPATVVDKRVDMGVGGRLIGSVDQQHLSAHPEVDHDRPAGVEGEREVLAAAVDIHHPGSGHPLDQRRPRGSSHHPLSSDRHRDETAAGEALGQAPTDHLDLGGLGHALAVESVEGGEGRGLLRVLLGAT